MIKKIILTILLLLLASQAQAYRDYYTDVILDTSGNPLSSARVFVYLSGTTNPANIYNSLTSTTVLNYTTSSNRVNVVEYVASARSVMKPKSILYPISSIISCYDVLK